MWVCARVQLISTPNVGGSRELQAPILSPMGCSKGIKKDMSCLMDYHIFQKSHRRSHGDSFPQSIGEKIDFGPRSNSIFFVKTDRIRDGGGWGCFVSPFAHAQRLPGFSVRSTLQLSGLLSGTFPFSDNYRTQKILLRIK